KGLVLEDKLFIANANNQYRILQLTDTHLFGQQEEQLLGLNTYESFTAVIKEIKQRARQYDLIIASGDLSQDQSELSYRHFVEQMATFTTPCVWIPGNHDSALMMENIFSHSTLSASKIIFAGQHWLILLLNSQVVGEPYGQLAPQQLSWLT